MILLAFPSQEDRNYSDFDQFGLLEPLWNKINTYQIPHW